MKELKLNRRTTYTRMVLRDSLLELMQQKPISKITVRELCDQADINRTTFYAHYSDQHDLLHQIENETLSWAEAMITELLRQSDRDQTMKILERILQYFVDNRKHVQVLMSEQGDLDFQKQLLTLIYRHCAITPQASKHADLVTKELYFVFVVNGSVGLIQHWLKNDLNKTAKEMAEIIYNMASRIR